MKHLWLPQWMHFKVNMIQLLGPLLVQKLGYMNTQQSFLQAINIIEMRNIYK